MTTPTSQTEAQLSLVFQSGAGVREEGMRVVILKERNGTENRAGISTDAGSSTAGRKQQTKMLRIWDGGIESADDGSDLIKLLGVIVLGRGL